jgi:anti-sigma factor RsiW
MAENEQISFEQLLDWVDGRLSPEEVAALARALAEGRAPAADARWLQAFQEARSKVVLGSPGADLHAALVAQFRPSPLRQALRRAAALLSFDSALQPAMAGMRSGSARARQLIFDCDLVEIALNMRPSRQSDQLDLNGQLFPRQLPDVAGVVVRLSRAGDLVDVVLTNEVGEFQFAALPPGDYALSLAGEDSQVAIDQLTLEIAAT